MKDTIMDAVFNMPVPKSEKGTALASTHVVLMGIARHEGCGPIRIEKIADYVNMPHRTFFRRLKALVKSGIVEKINDGAENRDMGSIYRVNWNPAQRKAAQCKA